MKLAEWENRRENERHRLLVEEAEKKQQGGVWTSVNKHRSKLTEKWMFRLDLLPYEFAFVVCMMKSDLW